MVLVASQHLIDGIQQVAPYHGDLVDDEQIQRAQDVNLVFREAVAVAWVTLDVLAGQVETGRQLEERVDGHATGIDGRHACRCHHDVSLLRLCPKATQEGGLACTCLACQEDVAMGILGVFEREVKFWVLYFH